jgi:hypothetical protein
MICDMWATYEMDRACGMYGSQERCIQGFARET